MTRTITGGFDISDEPFLPYFREEIKADEDELKFQDPKQQAKFKLGVLMALDQWEELKLAEEHYGGGASPSHKRDSIAEYFLESFETYPSMDLDDAYKFLCAAVELELDTYVHNASPYLVGLLIFNMYEECRVHDYSRIDDLYSRFQEKHLAGQFKRSVVIESDSDNHVKDEDGSDWTLLRDIGANKGTFSALVIVENDSD